MTVQRDKQQRLSGVADVDQIACNPSTLWVEGKCQTTVYNGKDGKTAFLLSVTSVARGEDRRSSNIRSLFPKGDMRRVMSDPSLACARRMVENMSDPDNNWYIEQAGSGNGKDILLPNMNAMR